MGVIDPVEVEIVDLDEKHEEKLVTHEFPKDNTSKTHEITLTRHIFVERDDVKAKDDKGFYGMAPGKLIQLKYAHILKINDVKVNDQGECVKVLAEIYKGEKKEKPKGVLHWVSNKDALNCSVRLYDVLFKEYNPNELEDYIKGMNPHSLIIKKNAKVNKYLLVNLKVEDKF